MRADPPLPEPRQLDPQRLTYADTPLSPGDYLRGHILSLKPRSLGGWLSHLTVLLLGPCVVVLLLMVPDARSHWFAWVMLAVWAMWVYTQVVAPLLTFFQMKRRPASPGEAARIWVSPEWVIVEATGYRHELRLDLIGPFRMSKRVMLLGSLILARSMYESDTDWQRLRDLVRRGAGECRKCAYALCGSISDTCPECGEPVATAVPIGTASQKKRSFRLSQ